MSTARDDLRAKILATRRPKSIQVQFFGETIEIRQPLLKEVLTARDAEDKQAAVINILVNNAYVPGTDEKVFETGDVESLMNMPFGGDFIAVTEALAGLTSVNFLGAGQKSETTQTDGGSAGSATA